MKLYPYTDSGETVSAPAVPASGTAVKARRDSAVIVSGGTVTNIAIDGTATGLTGGTIFVPAGSTITLTYTAAPTWLWTLLGS